MGNTKSINKNNQDNFCIAKSFYLSSDILCLWSSLYSIKEGERYKVKTDHLEAMRYVVRVSYNTILQEMEYDSFGNVIYDTNPGFTPFGFAGGLYDKDTGLIRFGARDYDPQIGRWTSKDPILFFSGDSNYYAYVLNNPIFFIDYQGYVFNIIAGAIGALTGGLINGVYSYAKGQGFWKGAAIGAATGFLAGFTMNPFLAGAIIGGATGALNYAFGIEENFVGAVGSGIIVGGICGKFAAFAGEQFGARVGFSYYEEAYTLGKTVATTTGGVIGADIQAIPYLFNEIKKSYE